jgi:hypothetical protein
VNDLRRCAPCPHRGLAVGWALHALEPADESPVAAHLPDCPICTSTAAETEEVGAALGLSVPQAMPSAELEQRVLSVTAAKWKLPVAGTGTVNTTSPTHHKANLAPRQKLATATMVIEVAAAGPLSNVSLTRLTSETGNMSESFLSHRTTPLGHCDRARRTHRLVAASRFKAARTAANAACQ